MRRISRPNFPRPVMPNTTITIHFDGEVVGKPRMTQSDKWRRPPRKCVADWLLFKDQFFLAAMEQGFRPATDLILMIEVDAQLPMPASWSKKLKQRLLGTPHDAKPDFDNILKGVADALTGDDSKIYRGTIFKMWSDDPGLEVTIMVYRKREETSDSRN
jgi:Holliday junction resolvase RusA-like endonuclease